MALDILAIFALLLAPAFAEHARIRSKTMKGFNLLFSAGTMFLLAVGFSVFGTVQGASGVALIGEQLFDFIGWVLLLVGSIMVTLDLSKV